MFCKILLRLLEILEHYYTVSYSLALPSQFKQMHSIFHMYFMKKFKLESDKYTLLDAILVYDQPEYEVDRNVQSKIYCVRFKYLMQ